MFNLHNRHRHPISYPFYDPYIIGTFPQTVNDQEQPDNRTEKENLMKWKIFLIVLSFELTIYSDCVYEIGLYGIGSVWKRHSWLISDIPWTWFRPFTCISDSWNNPWDHFKVPRLIPWYFERTWHTDLYQFH